MRSSKTSWHLMCRAQSIRGDYSSFLNSLPEETAASRTENAAPEQRKPETNDPANLSTAEHLHGHKMAMLVYEAEGRHYVAASDIHSGEVLLDEAPLAAVVCKSFQKLVRIVTFPGYFQDLPAQGFLSSSIAPIRHLRIHKCGAELPSLTG